MNIETELKEIPALGAVGLALVKFAHSLHPQGVLEWKNPRFVFEPNFVTFTIRHKRVKKIEISLRGNKGEFPDEEKAILPLKTGRTPSYCECEITDVRQLAAAARYIEIAHEIYIKGRSREKTKPVTQKISLARVS